MNIRIFTILTLIILSSTKVSSQTPEAAKTSFALLGGVNFQNFNGKDMNGDKMENKLIVGFHAGFNIMIPLVPEFYFQPGLIFSTKGALNKQDSFSNKYKLSYVEMPLNFVYKALVGNGYFMLGLGPYLAYGVKGKVISDYRNIETTADIKFKNTVELNDPVNPPYFKAFDAGANMFAGYEMASGIFLQLNTQFGLIKINPDNKRIPNDKTIVKNTGFGLSLGYRF